MPSAERFWQRFGSPLDARRQHRVVHALFCGSGWIVHVQTKSHAIRQVGVCVCVREAKGVVLESLSHLLHMTMGGGSNCTTS